MNVPLLNPAKLVFTENGTVEIQNATNQILWSSADHDEFAEEFGDSADPEDDEAILDWLEENNVLTNDQASSLEIFEDDENDEE